MSAYQLDWPAVLAPVRQSVRQSLDLMRLKRFLGRDRALPSGVPVDLTGALLGRYLISGEKGVYYASGNQIRSILPFYTFGISVQENRLFAAISVGQLSIVTVSTIEQSDDGGVVLKGLLPAFNINVQLHPERIHQIHTAGDLLAVANTRKNAITLLSLTDPAKRTDIFPLHDQTGFPVTTDHNHVNSVYIGEHVVWFVAHNGGNVGSVIGFFHGDKVTAAPFKNRGVHDIVPTKNGLLFSDTFGSSMKDFQGGGNLSVNGSWLFSQSEASGYMVRGVAGTGSELLVGSSHHGKREDRFKGKGGIAVLNDGVVQRFETLPFSQVFDIVRLDGHRLDDEAPGLSPAEARRHLEHCVGPIEFETDYHLMRAGDWDYSRAESLDLIRKEIISPQP